MRPAVGTMPLLLPCCLLLLALSAASPTLHDERDAITESLRTLFDSTSGSQWLNEEGIWFSNADPCTWFGISCTAGTITGIKLYVNGLEGTIPDNAFEAFPQLRELDLGGNN